MREREEKDLLYFPHYEDFNEVRLWLNKRVLSIAQKVSTTEIAIFCVVLIILQDNKYYRYVQNYRSRLEEKSTTSVFQEDPLLQKI